jgi:O-antigen biosynthesis protein
LLTSFEYHVLITLPMIVVAAMFRPLVPTAAGVLLLPIAVCVAAAWQAEIPHNKRRFWSRPLVALLFFLQPIVRGWERYKGRLDAPRSRVAARENLESLSRLGKEQSFEYVEYWNDRGIDRLDFLNIILERLDQRGWPNKADSGWNNFDIEIYGSAWSHLQLLTVSEILGQGKQLLRCRLKPVWSLFAKVIFWASLGAQLLLIGLLSQSLWWLAILLLTIPMFIWVIAKEQSDLQRVVSVFLDEIAAELKLKRIEPTPPGKGS